MSMFLYFVNDYVLMNEFVAMILFTEYKIMVL